MTLKISPLCEEKEPWNMIRTMKSYPNYHHGGLIASKFASEYEFKQTPEKRSKQSKQSHQKNDINTRRNISTRNCPASLSLTGRSQFTRDLIKSIQTYYNLKSHYFP